MKQGYYEVKIEHRDHTGINDVIITKTAYYNGQLFQVDNKNYLADELLSYKFIELPV